MKNDKLSYLFTLCLMSSIILAQQSKIVLKTMLGDAIAHAKITCDSEIYYSNHQGIANLPTCSAEISIRALGFRDTSIHINGEEVVELILSRSTETLREIEIFSSDVDYSEVIANYINHSWDVFKDHYHKTLLVDFYVSIELDSSRFEAYANSARLTFFSNRDWFPLIQFRGNDFRVVFDYNPALLNYERFSPLRYVQYHFPLNPIEAPLNQLEDCDIVRVRFAESQETYRITLSQSSEFEYEVFLTVDTQLGLIQRMEKRLISSPEHHPVYGVDSLRYCSPFSLRVVYDFLYFENEYILLGVSMEKEEGIERIESGEVVNSSVRFIIESLGVEDKSLQNSTDLRYLLSFPTSYQIEKWIEQIEHQE